MQILRIWPKVTSRDENVGNTYPLYTALLSDSRWIGNPINH